MRTILIGAAALALSLGMATAQQPHSAASIACSKQADAKGLHGKARHEFREKCKRAFGTSSGGRTRQN